MDWEARMELKAWLRRHRSKGGAIALGVVGLAFLFVALSNGNWSDGFNDPITAITVADDADGDGLPDAYEQVLGSDPNNPFSLGRDVPDGWIEQALGAAAVWDRPSILDAPVLVANLSDLPQPMRGYTPTVTLYELYQHEKALYDPNGGRGAWWLVEPSLDPLQWDNDGDSVSDGWLVASGLDPWTVDMDAPAPGDPRMTVREKYDAGLNAGTPDTDGDGLYDAEEVAGAATIGGQQTFAPTDPRRHSTRSDGIADGYLVRFGLDPHANQAAATPAGDGVTVREAYQASRLRCGDCDWPQTLRSGDVISPVDWDSNGDGVADAWFLRYAPQLDPLADAATLPLTSTAAWDVSAWDGTSGLVIDGDNPRPGVFTTTVADHYFYNRPTTWNEGTQGPWWGGLPANVSTPQGGLPVAVALRGWNLTVEESVGVLPGAPTEERSFTKVRAQADPRQADSDNDGLLDAAEYGGPKRTNPLDPDTDGDGLRDGDELGLGTNPLRRDTSGSYLTDGQERVLWDGIFQDALAAYAADPVATAARYAHLGPTVTAATLSALAPGGTIHGNTTNILSADADGDGLRDGEETQPDRFSPQPSQFARPPTDPSTPDTDQDGLPDAWEVRWSKDVYYGCKRPCRGGSIAGWPLDPTKFNSFGAPVPDADMNLADDRVVTAPGITRTFSNALAYQYDANPYVADSNEDGIPDMFSIHWGIEHAPAWAIDGPERFTTEAGRLGNALSQRGFDVTFGAVALSPTARDWPITAADDLLGPTQGREKGFWQLTGATCDNPLPTTGPRSSVGVPGLPDRQATGCWSWVAYPLSQDVQHGTNPWTHDFDADGLPDAWEAQYGTSATALSPDEPTTGSVQGGCQDPSRTAGLTLPATGACLLNRHAFAAGLDPSVADSDRGGLADWYEVVLGQDPLDPDDDHGDEDWDADGLNNTQESLRGTSPLLPDTDGDGLADGGDSSRPDGGLCHALSGGIVPGMAHRPGGALTATQLHDLYVDAGIVRFEGPNSGCPDGQALFLSEGVPDARDPSIILGAGTDPTKFDTSGDGLPDGWVVYWSRVNDLPLDLSPLRRIDTGNPDGDALPTGREYRQDMPSWWSAADGVWWGGANPGNPDTDGDADWYTSSFDGIDGVDFDNDNDGLVRSDTGPGVDTFNAAILSPPVDYLALWDALATRESSHLIDQDADQVPDWLDRIEVTVVDVTLSETTLRKNGEAIQVSGRLTSDAGAVGGATVVARLQDRAGNEAPAGFAVTATDGSFTIPVRIGPNEASAPRQVNVLGVAYGAGDVPSFGAATGALEPGPVTVHVDVEGNDDHQDITLGGQTTATATKQVGPKGYTLPDGRAVQAVRILNGAPDTQAKSVTHDVSHVFNSTYSHPDSVIVTATSSIAVEVAPDRILAGTAAWINATLTTQDGTALPGRTVTATSDLGTRSALTDDNGVASIALPTEQAGVHEWTVSAQLLASDSGIDAPAAVAAPVTVASDLAWASPRVGSLAIKAGQEVPVDAQSPVAVHATLFDHRGLPVAERPATLTLTALGATTPVASVTESTGTDGKVTFTVPALTNAPQAILVAQASAAPITADDDAEALRFFVLPRFEASLDAAPVVLQPGEKGQLDVRVVVAGEARDVTDGILRVDTLGRTFLLEAQNGRFTYGIERGGPSAQDWSIRFLGSRFILPTETETVRIVHRAVPEVADVAADGLREQNVTITGRFMAAGKGMPGATLAAGWLDTDGVADLAGQHVTKTRGDGRWSITLPARAAGIHALSIQYAGNETLVAAERNVDAHVRVPVILDATGSTVRYAPLTGGTGELVHGSMRDERGAGLGGRALDITLRQGSTWVNTTAITNPDGRFALGPDNLVPPGAWDVHVTYPGTDIEARGEASAAGRSIHQIAVIIDDVPTTVEVGEKLKVTGHTRSQADLEGTFFLHARYGLAEAGRGAFDQGPWVIEGTVPYVPAGQQVFTVGGSGPDFIEVVSGRDDVDVISDAHVVLTEVVEGDRRMVTVKASTGEGNPIPATRVTLGRTIDGVLVQRIPVEIRDGTGYAETPAQGSLSVIAIEDPALRLGATENVVTYSAVQPGPAPWPLAIAIAAIVAAIVITVLAVRRPRVAKQRLTLSLEEALGHLRASRRDANRVIQDVHARLLDELVASGFTVDSSQTARRIAEEASDRFDVRVAPLATLTSLYERSLFAASQMGQDDREMAIASLEAIAADLRGAS